MENTYIISEEDLISLLSSYHFAKCLISNGFNWDQYATDMQKYLGNFETFSDKARDDVKYYINLKDLDNFKTLSDKARDNINLKDVDVK